MSSKNVLYEITTRMEKEDYRRFSYLTIFKKKYQTILLIILLAAIGAAFAVFADEIFSVPKFLLIWAMLIVTAFAAISVRVEYKSFNRTGQIRAGMASVEQTITFYENYLIAESDISKGSNKIKYDRLYQVLETKDYYLIYASANSASLIRKMDIDDEDRANFQNFIQVKLAKRYKKI
ncbi:MAG TPA: YcxB family protein [Anaerovoracaceae bacterium]|nr:YcxB family protein [Anaerovoracaceae bacterium]